MREGIKAGLSGGLCGGKSNAIKTSIISVIVFLTAASSAYASAKILTIGIVNILPSHAAIVEGFKAGMTELGYVEGKDVKYIYNGVVKIDDRVMYDEARKLLSLHADMLLTVANGPAVQAKKAVAGTDIPVVAAAIGKVIEIGLVKDLKHPDGNLTGVRTADSAPKALEWLIAITPNARKIYLPYNPDEEVSVVNISGLNEIASKMGVELVLGKVHSVEEAVDAIENLPKDIDAIFRIPSGLLAPRNSELSKAAIRKGLPMGSSLPLDESVLITFGSEPFEIGRQTARLARQIHQGTKPADLPVETSDVFLTVNLKTAEKIGIKIPDNVLMQAKKIIR